MLNKKQQPSLFLSFQCLIKAISGEELEEVKEIPEGKKVLLGTALSWKWEKFYCQLYQNETHQFISRTVLT